MERSVEATTTVRAALGRVREILLDEPALVLCDVGTLDDDDDRNLRAELAVDMGGGTSIHQEVDIHLGVAQSLPKGGLAQPLTWEPTGHQRLFPAFVGVLEASATRSGTQLRLSGTYRVPLGPLGLFGEGVVGRQAARRSVAAFLEALARRRVDAEVDRHLEAPSTEGRYHPVAVREIAAHTARRSRRPTEKGRCSL